MGANATAAAAAEAAAATVAVVAKQALPQLLLPPLTGPQDRTVSFGGKASRGRCGERSGPQERTSSRGGKGSRISFGVGLMLCPAWIAMVF